MISIFTSYSNMLSNLMEELWRCESWDQVLISGSNIDLGIKHLSQDQAMILRSSIDLGVKH